MPRNKATCDCLAAFLSQKTGTDWTVLRGRPMKKEPRMSAPEPGPMRYQLKATRRIDSDPRSELVSYVFQANRPMSLGEITRLLASLCDMVSMGYIPVDPYRSGPATRAREMEQNT